MRLLKFRAVNDYSLSALEKSQLWFSPLKDFNDPFEGMHLLDSSLAMNEMVGFFMKLNWECKEEMTAEAFLAKLSILKLNEEDLTIGNVVRAIAEPDIELFINIVHDSKVFCLSIDDGLEGLITNNLMWSHYADGLRGFCLVFDHDLLLDCFVGPDKKIMRSIAVKYQNTPQIIKLSEFIQSLDSNSHSNDEYVHQVTATIATKSEAWSYENELRILSLDDEQLHEYEPGALIEIIIGDKMPEVEKEKILNLVKEINPALVIKKARLQNNSYQIEVIDY